MSDDETLYDEMLHDEFRSPGRHAAPEAAEEEGEECGGPGGFARFRTAAAVGAGGLACAALGAFAGGLGGHVTIAPAAAHSVATSSAPGHSLAASVNQGYRSSPVVGRSGAVAVASFATSGPLTQGGIAAFSALMPDPPPNRPVTASSIGSLGVPGAAGTAGGAGGTAGAPSDPPSPLEGLAPTMPGVVSDLTGALAYLDSLVPAPGLPTTGVPATGLLTSGLGSLGLESLAAAAPGTTDGQGSGRRAAATGTGALAGVRSGMAGGVGSPSGTSPTALPSLPLPSTGAAVPSVPSLPVTPPSGSLPAPPTVTTPSAASSAGSSTITVPLPALPVPVSTPTISGGVASVGIGSSGSTSGLTLTLP
jgi:hypothetical protein